MLRQSIHQICATGVLLTAVASPAIYACSAPAGVQPAPLVERVNAAERVFAGRIVENDEGAAVVETIRQFKGEEEEIVRIDNFYLSSCSLFPDVGTEAIFFVSENAFIGGGLEAQYDSIFGATVPLTEENIAALDSNTLMDTRLRDMQMDCAAGFNGTTLHVPCVKVENSEELYVVNLVIDEQSLISGQMLLAVEDAMPHGGFEANISGKPIDGEIVDPDNTSEPSENPSEVIVGDALVDSVEVLITDTLPRQASISVTGNLLNGCQTLRPLTFEGQNGNNELIFTLLVEEPNDVGCTQALVPFSEVLPLDTDGLEEGIYAVNVNGAISAAFAMPLDPNNSLKPSDIPAEPTIGDALIDSVEILMTRSLPPQVSVVVTGNLLNGCQILRPLTLESQQGNTFTLSLLTEQPNDEEFGCTQALVPFSEALRLNTDGLAAGTYIVNVNGDASTTFEMP